MTGKCTYPNPTRPFVVVVVVVTYAGRFFNIIRFTGTTRHMLLIRLTGLEQEYSSHPNSGHTKGVS